MFFRQILHGPNNGKQNIDKHVWIWRERFILAKGWNKMASVTHWMDVINYQSNYITPLSLCKVEPLKLQNYKDSFENFFNSFSCVSPLTQFYTHTHTHMSQNIPPYTSQINSGGTWEWKNGNTVFLTNPPVVCISSTWKYDNSIDLPQWAKPKNWIKIKPSIKRGVLNVFMISFSRSLSPLSSSLLLSPLCTEECFVWSRDKRNKRHHWQKQLCSSMCACKRHRERKGEREKEREREREK